MARKIVDCDDRRERLSLRARWGRLLRRLSEDEDEGDGAPLLEAIEVYRDALEDTAPDDGEELWRATSGELGATHLELFRVRGQLEHARRALRPLKNALTLYSPGTRCHRTVSRGIGEALLAMGRDESSEVLLKQAVQAFRLSLGADDAIDLDSGERAIALRELAGALRSLGHTADDVQALREALHYVDEALSLVETDEPITRMLLLGEARRIHEALARRGGASRPVTDALRAYTRR